MTLKATSMLLGTTTPESFSMKIHLLLHSYHVGETAFGNQFPAAHGDFQQTFIVPFTDFLINLYRESCSQGLFHCYLCKFLAAETTRQKQSLEYARCCKEEASDPTTAQSENGGGTERDGVSEGTSASSINSLPNPHIEYLRIF